MVPAAPERHEGRRDRPGREPGRPPGDRRDPRPGHRQERPGERPPGLEEPVEPPRRPRPPPPGGPAAAMRTSRLGSDSSDIAVPARCRPSRGGRLPRRTVGGGGSLGSNGTRPARPLPREGVFALPRPGGRAAPRSLAAWGFRRPRSRIHSSQRFGQVEYGLSLGRMPKPWPPVVVDVQLGGDPGALQGQVEQDAVLEAAPVVAGDGEERRRASAR